MPPPLRLVTVVIHPSGALKVASETISLDDASRWAEEGYVVFVCLGAVVRRALPNHVFEPWGPTPVRDVTETEVRDAPRLRAPGDDEETRG